MHKIISNENKTRNEYSFNTLPPIITIKKNIPVTMRVVISLIVRVICIKLFIKTKIYQ